MPSVLSRFRWKRYIGRNRSAVFLLVVANGIFNVVIPVPLPPDVAPYVCPMLPAGSSGFEEVWDGGSYRVPCTMARLGLANGGHHREFYDEEERVCCRSISAV